MTTPDAIALADRRELFVDDALLDKLRGEVALKLHQPVAREAILSTDQPWEGCMSAFNTIIRDGDLLRLYYRGWEVELNEDRAKGPGLLTPRAPTMCLAESTDGLHWERRMVGIHEYNGSRDNNIVFMGAGPDFLGMHGFSPFLDTNPACPPDQRYKAIGGRWSHIDGQYPFASADGIDWRLLADQPVITNGKFDSHNLAFWDSVRGEYRAYVRDFRNGQRDIRTCTSPDFLNWTDTEWIDIRGTAPEQLYTNNVLPYYRAPHLLLGFPARYVERQWTPTMEQLPELEHRRRRSAISVRYGTAVSDACLMSSRDGLHFHRWGDAFIRPGLRAQGSWAYGDIYPAWGLWETPSDQPGGGLELSLLTSENYWRDSRTVLRRHSLRIDGFASLNGHRAGGEAITRPLTFAGSRLELNVATSAAGSVRVELQDADGAPLPGFGLDDCWEIVGDTLAYTVTWKGGADVSAHAGRPIRLRLSLSDADLYSFRFAQ